VLVFLANLVLLGSGWFYYLTLIAQLALLGIAALSAACRRRRGAICRYYVLTQAAIVLGLWTGCATAREGLGEGGGDPLMPPPRQAARRPRPPRPLAGLLAAAIWIRLDSRGRSSIASSGWGGRAPFRDAEAADDGGRLGPVGSAPPSSATTRG